jgi:rhodanese-related sulfurtransferase
VHIVGFPYWGETGIKAWMHQAAELDDYWDAPSRALLWQPRTGKTKAAIDAACAWYVAKELKTVVIVAPNGVHANWVRKEIPKHCWVPYVAHAWSSRRAATASHGREVDTTLETRGLCFLAFGKESILGARVQAVIRAALKRGPCALFVDECHHFRTPGAKRTKIARGLAKRCVMRRIMTGTATGNSPLGLFSQFELLHPGALGFTRYTGGSGFEAHYATIGEGFDPRSGRRFKQVEGYKNEKELAGRVARWSSIVLRSDCEDLPELLVSDQAYEPSPLQSYAYESLRKSYVAELNSGSYVEAADSGTRLLRLQQILSNFVVTDALELETVDPAQDPRLDALTEAVSGPTIVWCRFRDCIRRTAGRLREHGLTVVEYHGGVRDEERAEAIDAFQAGQADAFIGQPACAGEGLELSAAETIVWYSHTFDVVVRDQANERATVVGGKRVVVVDIVAPGSVDEYIIENLSRKRSVAETITGRELKETLERCRI